jgi:hypothetical protein
MGKGRSRSDEMDAQNFVGGMTASYQQRENQPIDEDYIDEKWSQKYKSSINCAQPQRLQSKGTLCWPQKIIH